VIYLDERTDEDVLAELLEAAGMHVAAELHRGRTEEELRERVRELEELVEEQAHTIEYLESERDDLKRHIEHLEDKLREAREALDG